MLDYIRWHIGAKGYPPSIREIGDAVGITSTSVVHYNLNRLVRTEYIERDKNVGRGMRIRTPEPREDLEVYREWYRNEVEPFFGPVDLRRTIFGDLRADGAGDAA